MKSLYSLHQFSPAGIHAAAAMYGLECADPKSAQVLELGCGSGSHLLRYAVANPLSTSVGIDIDLDNITQGESAISTLGIENVNLYCIGIQDLFSVDPGKFDYIIIHDVFSLLDSNTRDALLSFCEQHLTPKGILAIKWNTLPGAQVTDTLREAIALHSQNARSDEERLSSAKAMLAFMDMAQTDGILKKRITEALLLSDTELAVRYIYNKNDANYLFDFTNEVAKSQLRFIGDVVPQHEMAQHYGKDIALVHSAATGLFDKITAQQYLDFAVDRQLRFSLMISNSYQANIHDIPQMSVVENLHWAGNYQRRIEEQTFYNRQGESLTSDSCLLGRILDVIGDSWPLNISTQNIIKNTFLPEEPEGHEEKVIKTLMALYIENVPGIYTCLNASPYNQSSFGTLKLIYKLSDIKWPASDEIELGNLWGEKALLTKTEWLFIESGLHIADAQDYTLAMDLASKGLLTGSDIAWLRLYQQTMALQDIDIVRRRISSLMLFSESIKNGGFRKDHASHKNNKKAGSNVDLKTLGKVKGLYMSGRIQESFEVINDLKNKYPESVELLRDAATIYHQSNDIDEALKCLTTGLSLNSVLFEFYSGVALCLSKKHDRYYPKKVAQHLLRAYPTKGEAWDLLGKIYSDLRNSLKHEYCARKAVDANGNNAGYLVKLGNVLSERNQMHEARGYLEKGVRLSESTNNYFANYSNMLFVTLHDHTCSQEDIFSEHQKFGQKISQWAKNKLVKSHAPVKDRSRLRIGFVSGDFRDHPVSNFIYPVLSTIDKTRFDVIGYNVSPSNDNHTQLYTALSTEWYEVKTLSHIELAAKITRDEIDILIDLSGHTAYNRLPVFGLKPAPVQMSWVGYPGTTGMQEMDYFIMGRDTVAPGVMDDQFTEKLAYMPSAKLFEHSGFNGDINRLPALDNGYITFGSFNRPQKITSVVLDSWAEILTQLPDAKFLLASMSDQEMIAHFTYELERRGVKNHQIIPRLKVGFVDYLRMHGEVDVLLDTFPYAGGTTVCHAYGMGVPTLTCIGDTVVSRQAGGVMGYLELHDFIAENVDDYIAKAIALDQQYEYLNTLRLTMRDRLKDIEQRVDSLAWYFEEIMTKAWRQHERGLAPEPIILPTL